MLNRRLFVWFYLYSVEILPSRVQVNFSSVQFSFSPYLSSPFLSIRNTQPVCPKLQHSVYILASFYL
ncbi:hypothetical protein C0J52_05674 [Blattella germanica]|nr:hypothetical protein C0J52_05674 [Blattella germanica]